MPRQRAGSKQAREAKAGVHGQSRTEDGVRDALGRARDRDTNTEELRKRERAPGGTPGCFT